MSPTLQFACLFSLILFFNSCQNNASTKVEATTINEPPLFQLLSPDSTNVHFENRLKEGPNTNVLMYEYFYNGGGVAAGDLNGDHKIDLYFTSNMGVNQIYLNQGNLQFEEVGTVSQAMGRPGPWKTGVNLVDINGDNKLDIYLCYSGAMPQPKRQNQLFVNQGNNSDDIPIFKEMAADYGLDSPAFSNQSYFFDYDLDGDLDMLLLNHNPKSLPILNENSTAQKLKTPDPMRGLRLFEQNNQRFNDITEQAGISGSELSYGLGVGISDLNNDGFPDFYVSNDYAIPDYLYYNNQDGTFSDQLAENIGHNSQFSMGNDIADINNDGYSDIITLDMLPEDNKRQKLLMAPDNYAKFDLNVRSGFHHQYMRNMLQLNNGNNTFSEIGQLAGMAQTDWSWAALLADFDNDGWKDLYVTNGYHRDFTNLDFIRYMDDYVKRKGRLQRADVLNLIEKIPASNVVNYLFHNQQDLSFQNKTKPWGLNHASNSNGAAYADLDDDGDLDLIVNNINKPAFIFENLSEKNNYLQIKLSGSGLNSLAIGAKVTLFNDNHQQTQEQFPARGYLSAVSPILHFGVNNANKIDSLTIRWPNGKMEKIVDLSVNQRLEFNESGASQTITAPRPSSSTVFSEIPSSIVHQGFIPIRRDFYRQLLLPKELSHQGPCMVKGDLNGDELEDVFIGGDYGKSAQLLFQQSDKTFVIHNVPAFSADKASVDTDAAIFDANGDGHPDIYIASGGYHNFKPDDPLLQDRLYLNDGTGNFSKSTNNLPEIKTSTSKVMPHDIDGDQDLDLLITSRLIPGRYPESPSSFIFLNDGKGHFSDATKQIAPEFNQIGMITDAVWLDLNDDEQKDLIVIGEWLPLMVFIYENGRLKNQTSTYFDQSYFGWWNTLVAEDFNGDGQLDLMVGNHGKNERYNASVEEPIELVFEDFDDNGSLDPFLCYFIQGKSYPDLTRDELLKQLVQLNSKFTTYESYSEATLEDILPRQSLKKAKKHQANHLATSLFLRTSDGSFSLHELPIQAQFAPVHTITTLDFNTDGNKDILLCGNDQFVKLRMGKLDANYGVLLEGKGNGDFKYVPQTESGLNLRGNVRCVLNFGNSFYFGITAQPVVAYRLN